MEIKISRNLRACLWTWVLCAMSAAGLSCSPESKQIGNSQAGDPSKKGASDSADGAGGGDSKGDGQVQKNESDGTTESDDGGDAGSGGEGKSIDFGIGGIWLSEGEIDKIRTSGDAFDQVKEIALASSWGTADLSSNDSQHDVNTLAGAIYAARTKDGAVRAKVVEALGSAMAGELYRALELSRGLQTDIIAADLIGHREDNFKQFVKEMVYAEITGHSGGKGLFGTAV